MSASKLIALTAAVLLAGELVAAWKLAVRRAILGLVIGCKLAGSGLRGVMTACKDLYGVGTAFSEALRSVISAFEVATDLSEEDLCSLKFAFEDVIGDLGGVLGLEFS